jgi:DNA (cytosine-5)-methyltransferase 1
MFSGAGGLSEGFFRSEYEFISHIEMDRYASMSLETRSLYHSLKSNHCLDDYFRYLKEELSREELFEEYSEFSDEISSNNFNSEISTETKSHLIRKIRKIMADENVKKIDGIIGGPPCQPYSLVGRNRSKNGMADDHRNYLYLHYIDFLREFDPDFFVFENVPGIKSAKDGDICRDFKTKVRDLGYKLDYDLLNAEDFNVLQSRKRLIIVGHKLEENFFEVSFQPNNKKYEVWNLLNDLPALHPGEGIDGPQDYKTPKISGYIKDFDIRTKNDILINHIARNHNNNDREIYRLAIKAWNNGKRRIQYDELPDDLKTHKNRKSFKDRFKVVAGDSSASHTIVAHIAKDGHYHIHPKESQARSLTVREAARIQSFPDSYKFEGSRTSQFTQVGNAVPPLMAEGIANRIKEFMGG